MRTVPLTDVRALIDGFPFYEGYTFTDGGTTMTIFQESPRPGENPASGLPGVPNRLVEKDTRL